MAFSSLKQMYVGQVLKMPEGLGTHSIRSRLERKSLKEAKNTGLIQSEATEVESLKFLLHFD